MFRSRHIPMRKDFVAHFGLHSGFHPDDIAVVIKNNPAIPILGIGGHCKFTYPVP